MAECRGINRENEIEAKIKLRGKEASMSAQRPSRKETESRREIRS